MPDHRYRAHGIDIVSEIELPGLSEGFSDRPNLRVARSTSGPEPRSSGERVVAELAGNGTGLVITTDGRRYRLQFGNVSVMTLTMAGDELTVFTEPGHEATACWLVLGTAIALALTVRGQLVLHASTVMVDGRAIVMLASSGRGKSTAAALMCSADATLLSEDVTTLKQANDIWTALPGGQLLRLRRTEEEGSVLFEPDRLSTSSDKRLMVDLRCPVSPTAVSSLALVALNPTAESVTVSDIDPLTALRSLISSLRVPGLVDRQMLGEQFVAISALADSRPTRLITVPWTGAIGRHLAHQLYSELVAM